MVKSITDNGKQISYDKVLEDKCLPPYWHRKYLLCHARWRRYYKVKARINVNPMLEMLIERAAVLHTKMQYYEHPDFQAETGVPIDNPLYMGKYDDMLKTILKTADQIQRYTESKPKAVEKKAVLKVTANITKDELKGINNDVLDSEIKRLISGEEVTSEEVIEGEGLKEGIESEQS